MVTNTQLEIILVTGAHGFIGKNLIIRLKEIQNVKVLEFSRNDTNSKLRELINKCTKIIHLAGENRPKDADEFNKTNIDLTNFICQCIIETGRQIPIIFTSSIQVKFNNTYGKSKLSAEKIIENMSSNHAIPSVIYRFPGVFGKWCRPNYNSVVATFCYNAINDIPLEISDPKIILDLVYIDDVIDDFLLSLTNQKGLCEKRYMEDKIFKISLIELAQLIKYFNRSRFALMIENVGKGLTRALYSTYISYIPSDKASYEVPLYSDERGLFVEMLKTKDSGQFSYFTIVPGITRGGHYHHSKTEKFLTVTGKAKFTFRNLISDEKFSIITTGEVPKVVDTMPGWIHNVTNLGDENLICLVWANEIFDRNKPDTIASRIEE